ncbi:MAG: right-handed parallel beta-helix repeat-containing protein [Bacteroidota bacterium]
MDCVAGYIGFLIDRGFIVENCVTYENKDDGFETSVGGGYRFEGCTAYNNEVHGFDVAGRAILNECNAYRNGGNGFDLSFACISEKSKASRNGFCIFDNDCENQPNLTTASGLSSYGNGIRVGGGFIIRNCTVNDNERVGIRSTNSDNHIVNNSCKPIPM